MKQIIRFTASWCAPCRMYAPIFTRVTEEYSKDFEVVTVDLDEPSELAEKYSVRSIPFTVIEDATGTRTKGGVLQEQALRDFIENK